MNSILNGAVSQKSGSTGVLFETNCTPNGTQTKLNLVAGSNVTITDDGTGDVTVAASGGGGGGVTSVAGTAPIASSGGTTPVISVATATTSNLGVVKPDGTTITISAGVISAVGGGGSSLTPPPTTGWTWVNQGGATVNNNAVAATMTIPSSASLNWILQTRPTPATPFTLIAYIKSIQLLKNVNLFGLYFYSTSSGNLLGIEFEGANSVTPYLRVERMNSVTSDNSTVFSTPLIGGLSGGLWMKLTDDGTNLTFAISVDGVSFLSLYSEAFGAFITPNAIGFGGLNMNTGQNIAGSVLSWSGVP
jgi:hypothetical protein